MHPVISSYQVTYNLCISVEHLLQMAVCLIPEESLQYQQLVSKLLALTNTYYN